MKIRKILSVVAASALAVSAMAVNSFAALYEDTLSENGAPANNAYMLAGVEGVDYSKVAKIEAVVTTTDYVNGTIGVSANGEWTTPGQMETKAGTSTWVLEGLSGIDSTLEDGSLKGDVVQVQFWWLNAGSFTLDSLKLFDAEGNVLQEAGAEAAAPSEPADEASYNVDVQMAVQDNVTWATQTSETVKIDKNGTYTFKLEGLSIEPSTLTVLYIKDAYALEQGDSLSKDYASDISNIELSYSLKINGNDVAIDGEMPTTLEDLDNGKVFDFCFFNTWATSYIALPDATITDVELVVTVSGGEAAPTVTEPEESKPEESQPEESKPEQTEAQENNEPENTQAPAAGDVNQPVADKNNADTGIEGVAAVAGLAVVAVLGVVVAKKRK